VLKPRVFGCEKRNHSILPRDLLAKKRDFGPHHADEMQLLRILINAPLLVYEALSY
jgi:hypothetical protein